MADDEYAAAEERAREARKAGLQAKKDEQPKNTARSYLAKQCEWKVGLPLPSPLLYSKANAGYRSGALRRVPRRTGPSIPGQTATS